MDEKTLKEHFEDLKGTAKWKWTDFKAWCTNHQAEITVFGPVVISAAVELIKIASKSHIVNKEKCLKEKYIYDRNNGMGHYFELRRKLKSSEWVNIEKRKSAGEPLWQILQDMKVLK